MGLTILKLAPNLKSYLRQGSLGRTTLEAIGLKATGALLALILSIVIARLLGAHGIGLFYLAFTVTTIASIIGRFGIDIVLLRSISSSVSANDWVRVRSQYKAGLRFVILSSGILSLLVVISSSFVASYVFSDSALARPLRLMALAVPLLSLVHLNSEVLKALRKVKKALLLQGILFPLIACFLVVPASIEAGLLGAIGAYVLAYACILFVGFRYLNAAMPVVDLPRMRNPVNKTIVLVKAGIPLLSITLLNVIIDLTDTLMLGIYMEAEDVGRYGVALRLTAVSGLILTAVNSVFSPEFSSLWASGAQERLQSVARKVTLVMVALAFLILAIFVAFSAPLLGLFGTDFLVAKNTLLILAIGQFFVLSTGPVAYLMMMTGHERFHRNSLVFCGLINVSMNVVLIPEYGIIGAALATAMALCIKNVLGVYYVREKLKIRVLV